MQIHCWTQVAQILRVGRALEYHLIHLWSVVHLPKHLRGGVMELCGIALVPGSSWPPLQLGQGQREVLPCTELNSFSVAYTH